MFQFYKFLVLGGWVMIPICAISVLALALFLERLWSLRRSRVLPTGLVERVLFLVRAGKTSEALVVCEQNGSAMALIIAAGLLRIGRLPADLKEAIEERGRLEAGRLDRFVEGLGTIAAIAPLLGLLGTVLGMVDLFRVVEEQTKTGSIGVSPGMMAAGIWKALITTVGGLTVAIPTYAGYKYLMARVNRLILDMEERAVEFVDLLTGQSAAPTSSPPPGPSTEVRAEAPAPVGPAPSAPPPDAGEAQA
jgi:biopolymer transport protein ExbB